jgi:alkanesulfonate monooxygenase SsuD/methylene tetrahydromethanopterin reductase-like flavin-dependent oxidoreductase (luciferase family)
VTTVAAPRILHLDPVEHGLVTPAGGSRDLDAMLDQARAAEADGAEVLVVPGPPEEAPARHHWPVTAQALAVLLATTTARVVVGIPAHAADPAALARFAASASGLAGGRLVVRVLGEGADAFAADLAARWSGPIVVGDARLA